MIKFSNKNYILLVLPFFIFSAGIFAAYSVFDFAKADEINDAGIVYPIRELGNCKDKQDCKAFCNDLDNVGVCVNFAEKKNLIGKEEAAKALAFAKTKTGPGGCKDKEECESYCDDINNIDECLNFAEKNSLMAAGEIKEAKQVAKALKEGAQMPGGCKNKNECESYCDDLSHMDECLNFAEKAGFIPKEELENARKAAKAFAKELKSPGGCKGRKECDAYCGVPDHMEECLVFAEEAGFLPKEEAEQARKMMPLMKAGKMPGGCKGKEECESYCQDENHFDECTSFAMEAGLMKPEEAEMFKKTGGRGPGGCRGKEECEVFCNNPENQEKCFEFAKEHNLIPPEEVEKMKEGMSKVREGLQSAPPEIYECLKSTVGSEVLNKIQTGTLAPSQKLGEQMRSCFEKFMPKMPEGMQRPEGFKEGEMMPAISTMTPGFSGPGGCQGPEECQKYCSAPEHQEECQKFGESAQRPENMNIKPPERMVSPSEEMMEKMRRERMAPEGTYPMPRAIPQEGYPISQEGYKIPEGLKPSEGYQMPENIKPLEGYIPPEGIKPPGGYAPPTAPTYPTEYPTAQPIYPGQTYPSSIENTGSNILNLFLKLIGF